MVQPMPPAYISLSLNNNALLNTNGNFKEKNDNNILKKSSNFKSKNFSYGKINDSIDLYIEPQQLSIDEVGSFDPGFFLL